MSYTIQWLDTGYFSCALKQSYLFQEALQMKIGNHYKIRVNILHEANLFHY